MYLEQHNVKFFQQGVGGKESTLQILYGKLNFELEYGSKYLQIRINQWKFCVSRKAKQTTFMKIQKWEECVIFSTNVHKNTDK